MCVSTISNGCRQHKTPHLRRPLSTHATQRTHTSLQCSNSIGEAPGCAGCAYDAGLGLPLQWLINCTHLADTPPELAGWRVTAADCPASDNAIAFRNYTRTLARTDWRVGGGGMSYGYLLFACKLAGEFVYLIPSFTLRAKVLCSPVRTPLKNTPTCL